VIIRFPSDQRDDLVENYGERVEGWIKSLTKSMVDPEFPILPIGILSIAEENCPLLAR
jgi:hypothetical protein